MNTKRWFLLLVAGLLLGVLVASQVCRVSVSVVPYVERVPVTLGEPVTLRMGIWKLVGGTADAEFAGLLVSCAVIPIAGEALLYETGSIAVTTPQAVFIVSCQEGFNSPGYRFERIGDYDDFAPNDPSF